MFNSLNKSHISILLWFILALSSPFSMALKPEHEAKRLLFAAEQALKKEDFKTADAQLQKARKLRISLPPIYDYYQAKVQFHKGDKKEARESFEYYVDKTGETGKHYKDSLKTITLIEQQMLEEKNLKPPEKPDKKPPKPKAELNWSQKNKDSNKYLKHLQGLYKIDNPVKALVTHINSLLNFYAYGDPRVTTSNTATSGIKHNIRTNSRGELVTISQPFPQGKESTVKEDKFPVFGINPYIEHSCNELEARCWLLHPVNSERWLQIVQSPDAVSELTKALTTLIKQLQKKG